MQTHCSIILVCVCVFVVAVVGQSLKKSRGQWTVECFLKCRLVKADSSVVIWNRKKCQRFDFRSQTTIPIGLYTKRNHSSTFCFIFFKLCVMNPLETDTQDTKNWFIFKESSRAEGNICKKKIAAAGRVFRRSMLLLILKAWCVFTFVVSDLRSEVIYNIFYIKDR